MTGTYLRGWKYDWARGKADSDRLFAEGREMMAAACADPGVVSCPQCGAYHWREFEVFLCCQCGAEVTIGETGTHAGLPKFPEKCPPRLFDGMRVRWSPKEKMRRGKPNTGQWSAGPIPLGATATVRADGDLWWFDFDYLTPRGEHHWGSLGDFLDEDFEHVKTPELERLAVFSHVSALLEAGVRGAAEHDIFPGWVYEARAALKHQTEQTPWLPDLLAALGWPGGTLHEALNAVGRLVAADRERRPT